MGFCAAFGFVAWRRGEAFGGGCAAGEDVDQQAAGDGAGFGEAAVGQGGLLMLRAFVRQFDSQKVDLDSLINRLEISSVPPEYQGGQATVRGRFRLWQGLSLMSERDSFGFDNAGATYRLRFR